MFKVEVIGNLGADAEVRDANGSKFITFRVAHSEKWDDGQGNKKERTQWIDAVISNAESKVLPFLKSGVKVYIRGYASLRVYSSPKERMMVAGCQVNVQDIELVGGIVDDVPRELINPETSEVYPTRRLYWSQDGFKGLKQGEQRILIDKKGGSYAIDHQGFITPIKEEPQEANKQQAALSTT